MLSLNDAPCRRFLVRVWVWRPGSVLVIKARQENTGLNFKFNKDFATTADMNEGEKRTCEINYGQTPNIKPLYFH